VLGIPQINKMINKQIFTDIVKCTKTNCRIRLDST
jgi:hypothetical protein